MGAKKCPMCQGEEFYEGNIKSFGNVFISLGIFSWAQVHGRVCLACGFLAPYVDRANLIAIRNKARWPWGKPREEPKKQEFANSDIAYRI